MMIAWHAVGAYWFACVTPQAIAPLDIGDAHA